MQGSSHQRPAGDRLLASPDQKQALPYLPDVWENDERMRNFLAAFRSRQVNPSDYDAKLKFWQELIEGSCKHHKNPVFTLKSLIQRFRRKGCAPLGLKTVISELIRTGVIQPLEQFRNPPGWVSWGYSAFVKRPMSYFLGYGSSSDESGIGDEQEFVLMPLVKEISTQVEEAFIASQQESHITSNVVEWHRLLQIARSVCADSTVFELAVLQLQRDGRATVDELAGKRVVKFVDVGEQRPTQVTELERSVLSLEQASKKLEAQIAALDRKAAELDQQARQFVKLKNRSQAMRALKEKKLVESKRDNKYTQLDNMEALLRTLHEKRSQDQIIDAYQTGVKAFKKAQMNPDKVNETMDQIDEMLSDQEEINAAIAGPPRQFEFDQDELEHELADLLASEGAASAADAEFDEPPELGPLPSVPTASPVKKRDRLAEMRAELSRSGR